MNFLPVITRELQVQARHPATNRMRWITAAVVIAIWGFLMVVAQRASAPERAKITFIAISVVALGGVMLAGVFQTADCLSEERREGTLGLLFLTDLRGYDVVLGKLVSTSLQTLYALLAGLPVLALPLLMGGTTVGEFWRVALVLLVTLYLSLAVGMFVSSFSREARGAMVGTFLGMVLLAAVLPLFWVLGGMVRARPGGEFLFWASPAFAYQQAFDLFYASGRGSGYWRGIFTMVSIATGCLAVACRWLPRLWQESGARRLRSRPAAAAAGRTPPRRSRPDEDAPFFWLATRDVRSRRLANLGFLVLLIIWGIFFGISCTARNFSQGMSFAVALFVAYGLHFVLKCLIAVEASRRLSEDRQSGALELLLVTPLPVAEIVKGQVRAVWRVFRWHLAALATVNLALLWLLVGMNQIRSGSDESTIFFLILGGGSVILFFDTMALTRVGMWQALIQKRHARAFMVTILRVLVPAWLAVFLLIFMGIGGAAMGAGGVQVLLLFWLIVGGLIDIVAAASAGGNLEQHFRTVISQGRSALAATGGTFPPPPGPNK